MTVVLLVDLDRLSPDDLRQIASAREALAPEGRARAALDDAAIDELGELVAAGESIKGWERRHLPVLRRPAPPRRTSPAQLSRVAASMVAEGCWGAEVTTEAVVELGVTCGLRRSIVEFAVASGVAVGLRLLKGAA